MNDTCMSLSCNMNVIIYGMDIYVLKLCVFHPTSYYYYSTVVKIQGEKSVMCNYFYRITSAKFVCTHRITFVF